MTLAAPTLQERVARRLDYTRARQDLQRDLEKLMSSGSPPGAGPAGVRVGVAALSSGPWHLTLQILLAHALRLRGAATQLLLCDMPDLPICNERLFNSRSPDRCAGCLDDKRELLGASGLGWAPMSAYVAPDAIIRARAEVDALRDDELRGYRAGGWPVGEWLDVSACHFLRRDGTGDDDEQVATRRRLLISAIVTVGAIEGWLADLRPHVVMVQGGVHFMWRIVSELARARGIEVVCREMGKGGWDHHLYALNRDSMAPDLDNAWLAARHEPLSDAESAAVDGLLDQLPARTFAGAEPVAWSPVINGRDGLRTIVAFTNVTWDMATARRDAGFAGLADWLRDTIRICAGCPDVRLIIRAHPAEAGNTRERVIEDVLGGSASASRRITLVPPTDHISAAALCGVADVVSVYNSTAGLEAAARGKCVLVGGRPHFRGRGFTVDVESRDHYRGLLDSWAAGSSIRVATDAAALARRYLHLFYLRYHIAMGWTTSPLEPPFALTIKSMRELAPGRNAALDVVCDGIMQRRQVLLPRELAGVGACRQ
jgi:hypothetical protein